VKILIITDCHHLLREEAEKLENLEYDVCFLLGDISGKYIDIILEYIRKNKIYGILGNHDEFGVLEARNIPNIHCKLIEINGITFLGFEGSNRYKRGEFPMFTQKEARKLLMKCPKADILLSHDSPYKLYSNGKDLAHCGLKAISKYIKKYKPIFNIHGHQHINSNKTLKNKTNVICVYRASIIDTETKDITFVF
jgi:Icc-related predicted phosphoesterase